LRRANGLEETGSPGQIPSPTRLNNYARTLIELARVDEAASAAERAYQEAMRLGNQLALIQNRLWTARICLAQHDPARATAVLDEAAPAMRKLLPPGHFALAILSAERALIARDRGDLQTARAQIDDAIGIVSQAARLGKAGPVYLPIFLTYRADIELAAQQFQPADTDLHRALDLLLAGAQPGDYSAYVGRAELSLARVLSSEGKPADARRTAQLAAQQLAKAEGGDHPETRAALELSKAL
jgi:hypothetical protein